jgi:glutamate carboxypeptidase
MIHRTAAIAITAMFMVLGASAGPSAAAEAAAEAAGEAAAAGAAPTSAEAAPAAGTGRDDAVYRAVEAGRAGALELLKSIVNVDSGTGDIPGGEHVEAILAPRLMAAGAAVRYVPAEANGIAPNLLAVFHGNGTARILIIAHIDTVFGPGTVAKRPFRIEGDRAYGPGVGDEKGGVVNAVTALEILHQLNFKDYATITLLIDSSEELGSPGSTGLIKALAKQNDVELNMEPGDPPDALTVWRKGSEDIFLQVHGRGAHAGMVPQNGRNAAVELVHQLAALEGKFPHSGDGTTVNLTVIKAGDRSNIIPDSAQATFDVRFRKSQDFAAVLARMQSSLAPKIIPDTTITVTAEGSPYPPLIENPQIDALGHRAQRIYAELGKRATLSGNGGASESAVAMSVGTPALDGLGFVGAGFHTDQEWIDLASVTPRMYLFTRLIMDVCRTPPTKS